MVKYIYLDQRKVYGQFLQRQILILSDYDDDDDDSSQDVPIINFDDYENESKCIDLKCYLNGICIWSKHNFEEQKSFKCIIENSIQNVAKKLSDEFFSIEKEFSISIS